MTLVARQDSITTYTDTPTHITIPMPHGIILYPPKSSQTITIRAIQNALSSASKMWRMLTMSLPRLDCRTGRSAWPLPNHMRRQVSPSIQSDYSIIAGMVLQTWITIVN